MNDNRTRIGERIKQLREAKGLDAKDLAQKAGLDAANLCRIEKGKSSVGLDILSNIADALGMKIDFVESSNVDMHYKFNAQTDPTDEQLEQLMKDAAAAVKAENMALKQKYESELAEQIKICREEAEKYGK